MRLRRDDLPDEGTRLAGTIAAPADGGVLGGLVAFAVDVRPRGATIELGGWLHATVDAECSRCLTPAPFSVDRDLELEYRPQSEAPRDAETELDDDELDIDYYPDDGLDLRAVLAEQVLLGLPMKVLCAEDCRGLCPQCGADRNRQPCDCEPPVDPRFADLAKLRERL